jgi:hypothetical protein
MKINRIVLTGILTLLGTFAATHPANLQAQTDADIYTNAFEVTVPIDISNFNFTPVTIPTGKRLVIQNVSMSGAAQTSGTDVQPICILAATIGDNPQVLRYFAPLEDLQVSGQYYQEWETTIYADTLFVSPAYSGFTPSFLSFNVVITGYLVSMPDAGPSPTLGVVPMSNGAHAEHETSQP